MNVKQQIEARLLDGFKFELGDAISAGFQIFGKHAGVLIGYTLIMVFSILISLFIPFVNILAMLFLMVAGFSWFFMGYNHFFNKALSGETNLTLSTLFAGFKINQGKSMGIFWLQILLGLIIGIPILYFIGYFDLIESMIESAKSGEIPDQMAVFGMMKNYWWLSILQYIFNISIYAFWMFLAPLVDDGLSLGAAISTGFKMTAKKFPILFLMQFLGIILLYVSALPCGLGLFVMIPVFFAMNVAAYHQFKGSNTEQNSVFTNMDLLDS